MEFGRTGRIGEPVTRPVHTVIRWELETVPGHFTEVWNVRDLQMRSRNALLLNVPVRIFSALWFFIDFVKSLTKILFVEMPKVHISHSLWFVLAWYLMNWYYLELAWTFHNVVQQYSAFKTVFWFFLFSVDGFWMEWSEWNECTRTCGGGTQEKNRTCFGPYFGGLPCDGDEIKTQACNTQPCPGIVQRFPAVCRLE